MPPRESRLRGRLTGPELAVFVSGVVSMGLEILAGRMVAPQFGSSIYTWGSVIGVFLAALSLGYHLGGKRAATRASERRLVGILLATAAYVAVLVLAGDQLLSALAGVPLPARFASLPAVTVLFGPPTYLLGYISPYGAELSDRESHGEASGHVYAVGTVGSIVGAFATTFLLVPTLRVDLVAVVFGVLLIGTSLILLSPEFPRRSVGVTVLVAVLLVGSVSLPAVGYSLRGETIYRTQTPYQELVVADRGDVRTLYLDGQPHSAMDTDDPTRHVFDYTSYFHVPLLLTEREGAAATDDVDRVLFVGGGGFTGPRRFVEEYDATVDVVEIDPEVVGVAKEYFGVEEGPQLNVYTAPARQFLRDTDRTYDVIVLDAYKKDKVPFQLTTVEFMRLTERRLDDDGVLLANLISAPTGPASRFYRAEYRTMNRVYPQVYGFPTVGGSAVQNVELVATKRERRVTERELQRRNDRRDLGIDLTTQIRSYRSDVDPGDAPVLRDGNAPVNALLEPMAGQRYVVDESRANDTRRSRAERPTEAQPSRETPESRGRSVSRSASRRSTPAVITGPASRLPPRRAG
ncbi:spermidine synthase [Salinirarus marinus]|uniref:spermidine synthase n=1 Tax=Salinirarus marinus TaxID=3068310 RepID=UPI003C6C9DF7